MLCQEAIDVRLKAIEDLNREEQEAFELQGAAPRAPMPPLLQPSGIIGAAIFLLGAILSFYLAMVIGMVMLAVYISTFARAAAEPAPTEAPRRYEWRP